MGTAHGETTLVPIVVVAIDEHEYVRSYMLELSELTPKATELVDQLTKAFEHKCLPLLKIRK